MRSPTEDLGDGNVGSSYFANVQHRTQFMKILGSWNEYQEIVGIKITLTTVSLNGTNERNWQISQKHLSLITYSVKIPIADNSQGWII